MTIVIDLFPLPGGSNSPLNGFGKHTVTFFSCYNSETILAKNLKLLVKRSSKYLKNSLLLSHHPGGPKIRKFKKSERE